MVGREPVGNQKVMATWRPWRSAIIATVLTMPVPSAPLRLHHHLDYFVKGEWHLLMRYLLVVGAGLVDADPVGRGEVEAWTALCRGGLHGGPQLPCDHNPDDEDAGVVNWWYRELGIHGRWNWLQQDHVKYIHVCLKEAEGTENVETFSRGEVNALFEL